MFPVIDLPKLEEFQRDLVRCEKLAAELLDDEGGKRDVGELSELFNLAARVAAMFERLGPSIDLDAEMISIQVDRMAALMADCIERIAGVK